MALNDFLSVAADKVVTFVLHLVLAIAVFYIGRYIVRKLNAFIQRILVKRKADPSIASFVKSATEIVLYFVLIIIVIGILGIETSSFIALFASAGVAIGMALSGTLQNFAGGVLILSLRPYSVGDYIEAQGFAGTVKAIQMFSTIITTADNKTIIIPNGPLSNGSVNNYSKQETRRVDWTVSLAYGHGLRARQGGHRRHPCRRSRDSQHRGEAHRHFHRRPCRQLGRHHGARLGSVGRLLAHVLHCQRTDLRPDSQARAELPVPAA